MKPRGRTTPDRSRPRVAGKELTAARWVHVTALRLYPDSRYVHRRSRHPLSRSEPVRFALSNRNRSLRLKVEGI
jgi:hypothetical protein